MLPDNLREFDDTTKTRRLIYDNALSALKRSFPVEDDDVRLELADAAYSGPMDYTLEQQKQALLRNRRLHTPIRGRWRLVDRKSGSVIDEREDVVLNVPYYTQRGTTIDNGNEYVVVSQARLRPGAYVRRRNDGNIETHFNIRPGTGRGFHLGLQPDTGVFKMIVAQGETPLYPVLKALGVSDESLAKQWGPELLKANMSRRVDPRVIPNLYRRFAGSSYDESLTPEQQTAALAEMLPRFGLDGETVARTLGIENVTGVTPDVLLRATGKMLGVYRGEEKEDDRDHPVFAEVYSIEDMIPERIEKDAGRLARSMLARSKRERSLKRVRRAALDPYIRSLFLGSGLAMPLEETNPVSILEQLGRITRLGEGGIGSSDAITDSARDVNPGQFGFIDPVAGPEGTNIGVDVRAAYRTFKGADRRLYGEFRTPDGETRYLTPGEVMDNVVAFPGQLKTPGDMAVAMVRGDVRRVPKADVAYEVPSFAHLMSPNANLNPMPTGFQPGRGFYATKFWGQFMPLAKGEEPLVDTLVPDSEETFSQYLGRRLGSITAPAHGTVTKVTQDAVTVRDRDGKKHVLELTRDFPFNRLTSITYTPVVKPGDEIPEGGMLARSNFTTDTGALSLGVNLRTAVVPARGASYEDAYAISETAARKLTTTRLYGFDTDAHHGITIGRGKFLSLFPSAFSRSQLDTIGPDGVVKQGTTLRKGDPITLATGPKLLSPADAQLGRLHKALRSASIDKSVKWEHDYPGVVVDAVRLQNSARVNVKSEPPVDIGDKLTTRFGLKGVTGRIIPDEEMPRDPATGEPYELLLNPMGVLSRVAPAQLAELALGKVAKRTGKQVLLPSERPEEGWNSWAMRMLEENGLKAKEPVFDPVKGRTLKPVGTGYVYVSAFHHLADKKLSARGLDGSWTIDEQPAKGGEEGAKRFGRMDADAILAHGAPAVVKDALAIRGSRDDAFWQALKTGRPLPEPKVPFIYDKFLNTLRAGGINVVDKGSTVGILPMTDRDAAAMSRGEIKSSRMLDKDYESIEGGLFDVGITGGVVGNRWATITLPEPVPNPVMEEPVRRVLGLTRDRLRAIVSGDEELNGKTGGAAIRDALASIDVDSEIEKRMEIVRKGRGARRDDAVKAVGFLEAARKQGISPADWTVTKVPVLPPMFRPISRMGDVALVPSINELYANLLDHRDNIAENAKSLPRKALSQDYGTLYDAVSAVYGLGDPITPEGKSKRLHGAIRQVIGENAKHGLFQSKVISKTVAGVGRGVVTPDPNMDMDTVGIPEDSAWTVYGDFVKRGLVRRGYSHIAVREMMEKRDPVARQMLDREMSQRPLLVTRAPVWHKFNILAFKPSIVEGSTIRVSPLVSKGFTLDHDGDDQIGKVLIHMDFDTFLRIHGKSASENNVLTWGTVLSYTGDTMKKNHIVPASHGGVIVAVDLEDFPHGEFVNHVDGERGAIDFYAALPGTSVVVVDADGKLGWSEVAYWSKHYQREVEVVTLSDGRQIITDDDPRAVFGIDPNSGSLEFVRDTPSNAAARGIVVPVVQDTGELFNAGNTATSVRITDMDIPFAELELDTDFGWYLGATAGDGWWDRSDSRISLLAKVGATRKLHIADHSGYNADRVRKFVDRLAGGADIYWYSRKELKSESPGRYGDSVKHSYAFPHAEVLAEFLSTHLGGHRDDTTAGSGNKKLPVFAFTAPREFRLGMLCGLLDTDGSVCVSHASEGGRRSDQLRIAFTSTSMRLVRDVQLLARTLGIRSTISSAHNKANDCDYWSLCLSTVDCKRTNALAGLTMPCKREAFLTTKVAVDSPRYDYVVLPRHIGSLLLDGFRVPKVKKTADDRRQFSGYMSVKRAMERGFVLPRAALSRILDDIGSAHAARMDKADAAREMLRRVIELRGCLTEEVRREIQSGITILVPSTGDAARYREMLTHSMSLRRWVKSGRQANSRDEETLEWFAALPPPPLVLDDPEIRRYLDFISTENLSWATVESVEKTGQREDGYDLTVPGYETFMSSDGVILSNTMNFHVPVSDKAVSQAMDRMLPSKGLFSATDLATIRHSPSMEMTMGLYWLTQNPSARPPVEFATLAQARRAYDEGRIAVNDPITILEG